MRRLSSGGVMAATSPFSSGARRRAILSLRAQSPVPTFVASGVLTYRTPASAATQRAATMAPRRLVFADGGD